MSLMNMKSKGKPLSDREKEAKMKVVEAMRDMATSEMSGKLKGLKKVTVASSDEKGLAAGLEKAKEMIARKGGEGSEISDALAEGEEESLEASDEEEVAEESVIDSMSEQEVEEKLAELMALKEKMSARKG